MKIAISVGDPAGVGTSVTVRALAERFLGGKHATADAPAFVCFGDAEYIRRECIQAGWKSSQLRTWPEHHAAPGTLGLCHVASWSDDVVKVHAPSAEGGRAQLDALRAAATATLEGEFDALVTGPTSKAAITLSGESFVGQTEYLASLNGLPSDGVTMMFLGPRLRVALVTTHVSVRLVSDAITQARVARSIQHLVAALRRLQVAGSVEVTGLNPHAGEQGLFGDEDTRVIAPAVVAAQQSSWLARDSHRLVGPIPAETTFRRAAAGELAGVVTMMHDQATIASKILDFGDAVNVTWGLPFIRTSVDHGVAYDAAAKGVVDHSGMRAAIDMAERLLTNP